MRQENSTHRSLEKALEILLSFAPHNPEMSTQELSDKLGFHRSTVNRVLHVLEKYGFMQQNPETRNRRKNEVIRRLAIRPPCKKV